MNTSTIDAQPLNHEASAQMQTDQLPGDLSFDLDITIDTKPQAQKEYIRSWFICTPGCTSPGGGSFCSFCC